MLFKFSPSLRFKGTLKSSPSTSDVIFLPPAPWTLRNWNPKQVPQSGKTSPASLAFFARLKIILPVLEYGESYIFAPPPGNKTLYPKRKHINPLTPRSNL